MNDRELNQTIRERLKDDGRLDLDELHVVCRKGVVHLSGKVPSRAEHEILLQTLTDVLGFREITDHVEIEELLWENNRRAKKVAPQQTQRWEESPGTEDVIEATEEDQDYVAPAKPTPGEQ